MNSTYAQKSSTVQKVADSKAASILDSSSQGESLQRKADMANGAAQRAEAPRPNNTGMPDNLKAGIESLSGFSMDNVRVHYNSSKPATVQALAYTQGTDIHVAPGQEKCLPHEAWHVAQQMAGRVSPTTNINGMPVNDNAALEHEADVMGEKAVTQRFENNASLCRENIDIDTLQLTKQSFEDFLERFHNDNKYIVECNEGNIHEQWRSVTNMYYNSNPSSWGDLDKVYVDFVVNKDTYTAEYSKSVEGYIIKVKEKDIDSQHSITGDNWKLDSGKGDLSSKYIAERGRFTLLASKQELNDESIIFDKLTAKEVWGNFGDIKKLKSFVLEGKKIKLINRQEDIDSIYKKYKEMGCNKIKEFEDEKDFIPFWDELKQRLEENNAVLPITRKDLGLLKKYNLIKKEIQ